MAAACDERQSCLRSCSRAVHPRSVRSKQNDQQQPPVRRHRHFRTGRTKRCRPGCASAVSSANASRDSRIRGFTPERDDSYFLSRLRINAVVTPSRLFSATVQLQDARVAQKEVGPTTPPFRGPLDLRMAYADIGDVQKGVVSVRAGRQELAFGEQRLIGHLNWTNTARSFDGARATIRRGGYQVDVFGASVVRIEADSFDESGNGNRLGGAYGSLSALVPECGRRALLLLARRPRPAHRKRDDRRPQSEDDRHALQREAAGRTRLRDRDRRADGLSRLRLDRRLGRPLAAPRVVRRQPESPADWRVQLRERRRRRQPTARAGRSISCIRPATTSWASPIRSDGATSVTLAPASRSHRCADGRSPPATTPGGSPIDTTPSTTPAARRSRASPAAPHRRTSVRRSTSS